MINPSSSPVTQSNPSMASFTVFRRVYLILMLYLASASSLALSETALQVSPRILNTTLSGNPVSVPDTRNPPFIINVARGLNIARSLVGYPVALVEISTAVPSGYPSSNAGDFTQMFLFLYIQATEEVAILAAGQRWGTWDQHFLSSRPAIAGVDQIIPLDQIARYDQIHAFNALPNELGPWYIVFLRIGTIREHVAVPIWHFGNPQMGRCTFATVNRRGRWWYVGGEPNWRCADLRSPGNVSVPQSFSLADANKKVTSSSSSSPLSIAGSNASEVGLSTQNHDSINETNGDFGLGATS